MWYVHTMENQSAIKMNDLLTQTATWMNLQNICYSKEGKVTKYMIPLYTENTEKTNPWRHNIN